MLKIKWVCDVAKRKSFLSSFLVVFRWGLWLKMRFIAISMASWSGILNISKKTSYIAGNKKFSEKICILNLRNKRKLSLQEQSLGTTGERRSQKKQARS